MVGVEACNGCRLLNSPWLCREEVCHQHEMSQSKDALKAENARLREALEHINTRWMESGSLAVKHMAEIAKKALEVQNEDD